MKRYRKSVSICVKAVLLVVALAMTTACTKEEVWEHDIDTTGWNRAKVAVVVPLSGDDSRGIAYERISSYFEENVIRAQHRWADGLILELEWYDEQSEDLEALARSFSKRTDLKAVIGPIHDEHVDQMAGKLCHGSIPMFVMSASEDLVRKYSCGEAGVEGFR